MPTSQPLTLQCPPPRQPPAEPPPRASWSCLPPLPTPGVSPLASLGCWVLQPRAVSPPLPASGTRPHADGTPPRSSSLGQLLSTGAAPASVDSELEAACTQLVLGRGTPARPFNRHGPQFSHLQKGHNATRASAEIKAGGVLVACRSGRGTGTLVRKVSSPGTRRVRRVSSHPRPPAEAGFHHQAELLQLGCSSRGAGLRQAKPSHGKSLLCCLGAQVSSRAGGQFTFGNQKADAVALHSREKNVPKV